MKKILVVDDDILILRAITQALSNNFFEVMEAQSGSETERIVSENSFDLIILDVKMPGQDGISTLEKLRKERNLTPIILLTGYADDEAVSKAKKYGIDAYFLKPFEMEDLIKQVVKSLYPKGEGDETIAAVRIIPEWAVRYRYVRKTANRIFSVFHKATTLYFRWLRRLRFRVLRVFIFSIWRHWLGKVDGLENLMWDEPCIIASNHTSYYDFMVLAPFLGRQTVFLASKSLDKRSFVGWFMKFDTIIYVDRDKPGYKFFKEIIRQIKLKRMIVIYPEGTRSRSGKMLAPKLGFLKLAMMCRVPIIPLAMKGTYNILPPHKKMPRFTKCDIEIGKKISLTPSNPFLRDVFLRTAKSKKYSDLTDEGLEEIGFRIMNEIRKMSGQDWDETAVELAKKYNVLNVNEHKAVVPKALREMTKESFPPFNDTEGSKPLIATSINDCARKDKCGEVDLPSGIRALGVKARKIKTS